MSKITNKSPTVLLIGRFTLSPGQSLPALPLTSNEQQAVTKFIEKGWLTSGEPERIKIPEVPVQPVVLNTEKQQPVKQEAETLSFKKEKSSKE